MARITIEDGRGFIIDPAGARLKTAYQRQVHYGDDGAQSATITVSIDSLEIKALFAPPQRELRFELESGETTLVVPTFMTTSVGIFESIEPARTNLARPAVDELQAGRRRTAGVAEASMQDGMALAVQMLEAAKRLAPQQLPLVMTADKMVIIGEFVLTQAETIRRLTRRLQAAGRPG